MPLAPGAVGDRGLQNGGGATEKRGCPNSGSWGSGASGPEELEAMEPLGLPSGQGVAVEIGGCR